MRKAVITAAGSGSRLLPFSKEVPKEMLPYCAKAGDGRLILKPIIQAVYELLYDCDYREFCFIVGRGKRAIEDYFLVDRAGMPVADDPLWDLYGRIDSCNITYVQQPSPLGFGDAVLRAKSFVNGDNFLLHVGDDVILSPDGGHITRLEDAFLSRGADLAFLVDRVEDPRQYGVIEGVDIGNGLHLVRDLEEKPKRPKTNLAVVGTYIFKPSIFDDLGRTEPDKDGKIQLEDAIRPMIARGKCIAVELREGEQRLDVGTPEGYAACIRDSFENSSRARGGAV